MTPRQVLDGYDRARLWSADAGETTALNLAEAYQTQLAVTALRMQRGEQLLGGSATVCLRRFGGRCGIRP